MITYKQTGALRWEEQVRLERANGLREDDMCVDNECGCNPHEEAYMVGMTYEELAQTPLKQNAVCPHTKVIVPVVPAMVVTETVKEINTQYPAAPYKVVDMNPCDGRVGVLNAIPQGMDTEVKHANTVITHSERVEDTFFDTPNLVKTVTTAVVTDEAVKQPIATNGTEPDNTETENGKDGTKKKKGKPVVDEVPQA